MTGLECRCAGGNADESESPGQVPSRLIVLPNAGHWPGGYEMAFYFLAHLDWFHTWLGGGEPPWDLERFLRNQVFDEGDTLGAPPSEGAGSD